MRKSSQQLKQSARNLSRESLEDKVEEIFQKVNKKLKRRKIRNGGGNEVNLGLISNKQKYCKESAEVMFPFLSRSWGYNIKLGIKLSEK